MQGAEPEGDDVPHHLQGLQLDIGAPPQIHGLPFHLRPLARRGFTSTHRGALLDVEPMGDDCVIGVCTIEDPTFDATAIATNPRAGAPHPPAAPQARPTGCIALCVDRHHRRSPG